MTTTTRPRRLDAAEEAALIARAQAGDEQAFTALADAQRNYFRRSADAAASFGTHDAEDLVQVGLVAYWEAVQSWDASRGARLFGHARYRVSTAMWEEVAEALGTSETVLRYVALAFRKTEGASLSEDARLAAARDFATSPDRGSHRMTAATFDVVTDAIRAVRTGEVEGCASTPGETAPGAEYLARLAEVVEALDGLSDRERRILARYYGLDDLGGATDAEIAAEEGVTREGVTKARTRALTKVRKALHA